MADIKSLQRAHPDYMEMFQELTDTSKSKEEITAVYDKWSNYEEIIKLHAPNRSLLGAKAFKAEYENLNKEAKILDIGAGTGLAAHELVKLGFTNIDALEPCETLANLAMKKNIYKKLYKAYLCKDRLPIEDNVYDIIYSVGVFAPGHAREDAFEELFRILKPGGQMMTITGEGYLKDPQMSNFEPRMAELEKEGILIRRKREILPFYSADENGPMNGMIFVLEKPAN